MSRVLNVPGYGVIDPNDDAQLVHAIVHAIEQGQAEARREALREALEAVADVPVANCGYAESCHASERMAALAAIDALMGGSPK